MNHYDLILFGMLIVAFLMSFIRIGGPDAVASFFYGESLMWDFPYGAIRRCNSSMREMKRAARSLR